MKDIKFLLKMDENFQKKVNYLHKITGKSKTFIIQRGFSVFFFENFYPLRNEQIEIKELEEYIENNTFPEKTEKFKERLAYLKKKRYDVWAQYFLDKEKDEIYK
jgi:hypothetical protein